MRTSQTDNRNDPPGICKLRPERLTRSKLESSEVFPLVEGTSWVYQGTVRWYDFNSVKVAKTRVTWTTQVKRVTRHAHLTAAVINGFPWDLDWSDGDLQPSDALLLASDDGGYYVSQFDDIKDGVKRLADSNDSLQDLINPDDVFSSVAADEGQEILLRLGRNGTG